MLHITPITDAPLLVVKRDLLVLVAADIHLGIEYELWLGGASIPSQTKHLLEKLLAYIDKIKPDRLVLLGDTKHNVPRTSWQERKEVPAFLKALSRKVDVDIVPGNHDGGIKNLVPSETRIKPASGFILDEIGYFHGHTWPDEKLLCAEKLITAHIHPTIRLTDALGYTSMEPVWVRTMISGDLLRKRYNNRKVGMPEMIILPAFNGLCGGFPLNASSRGEDRGPIPNMTELDWARIYLLDGTDLGRLDGIKAKNRDNFNRSKP
jgi:putative SbcD/Mre11-related phosphoesterase